MRNQNDLLLGKEENSERAVFKVLHFFSLFFFLLPLSPSLQTTSLLFFFLSLFFLESSKRKGEIQRERRKERERERKSVREKRE
jgi:flagellar biosynthesis component FlhA